MSWVCPKCKIKSRKENCPACGFEKPQEGDNKYTWLCKTCNVRREKSWRGTPCSTCGRAEGHDPAVWDAHEKMHGVKKGQGKRVTAANSIEMPAGWREQWYELNKLRVAEEQKKRMDLISAVKQNKVLPESDDEAVDKVTKDFPDLSSILVPPPDGDAAAAAAGAADIIIAKDDDDFDDKFTEKYHKKAPQWATGAIWGDDDGQTQTVNAPTEAEEKKDEENGKEKEEKAENEEGEKNEEEGEKEAVEEKEEDEEALRLQKEKEEQEALAKMDPKQRKKLERISAANAAKLALKEAMKDPVRRAQIEEQRKKEKLARDKARQAKEKKRAEEREIKARERQVRVQEQIARAREQRLQREHEEEEREREKLWGPRAKDEKFVEWQLPPLCNGEINVTYGVRLDDHHGDFDTGKETTEEFLDRIFARAQLTSSSSSASSSIPSTTNKNSKLNSPRVEGGSGGGAGVNGDGGAAIVNAEDELIRWACSFPPLKELVIGSIGFCWADKLPTDPRTAKQNEIQRVKYVKREMKWIIAQALISAHRQQQRGVVCMTPLLDVYDLTFAEVCIGLGLPLCVVTGGDDDDDDNDGDDDDDDNASQSSSSSFYSNTNSNISNISNSNYSKSTTSTTSARSHFSLTSSTQRQEQRQQQTKKRLNSDSDLTSNISTHSRSSFASSMASFTSSRPPSEVASHLSDFLEEKKNKKTKKTDSKLSAIMEEERGGGGGGGDGNDDLAAILGPSSSSSRPINNTSNTTSAGNKSSSSSSSSKQPLTVKQRVHAVLLSPCTRTLSVGSSVYRAFGSTAVTCLVSQLAYCLCLHANSPQGEVDVITQSRTDVKRATLLITPNAMRGELRRYHKTESGRLGAALSLRYPGTSTGLTVQALSQV